jgi:glycine dehydrogenase subunit 1
MAHNQPFLNEFAVKTTVDISLLQKRFIEAGIFGGLKIAEDTLLFCVTEMRSKEEIDQLVNIVKQL